MQAVFSRFPTVAAVTYPQIYPDLPGASSGSNLDKRPASQGPTIRITPGAPLKVAVAHALREQALDLGRRVRMRSPCGESQCEVRQRKQRSRAILR